MQYMDRTIQNTEVFDIVFNGICSIEVPAKNTLVEITQTDLPVDFLKNIGYIEGNVTISGNGNGVRHSASEWLSEMKGQVIFSNLTFENYITKVPLICNCDKFTIESCVFEVITPSLDNKLKISVESSQFGMIAVETISNEWLQVKDSKAAILSQRIGQCNYICIDNTTLSSIVDIDSAVNIDTVNIYNSSAIDNLSLGNVNTLEISGSRISVMTLSSVTKFTTSNANIDNFEGIENVSYDIIDVGTNVIINGVNVEKNTYDGATFISQSSGDETSKLMSTTEGIAQLIRQEKESGNVDYLAPYLDILNQRFKGEITLVESKRPCGGMTVALSRNEGVDYPGGLQQLIYGGICGIELRGNRAFYTSNPFPIKNPPADFLRNIYYVKGMYIGMCDDDLYCGILGNSSYRYEPSQNLNCIINRIAFENFNFESYMTMQTIDSPSNERGALTLKNCKLRSITPSDDKITGMDAYWIYDSKFMKLDMPFVTEIDGHIIRYQENVVENCEIDELVLHDSECPTSLKGCKVGALRIMNIGIPNTHQSSMPVRIGNTTIGKVIWDDFQDNTEGQNFGLSLKDDQCLIGGVSLPQGKIKMDKLRRILDRGYL